MHGALVGDLEEARTLIVVELALERDCALDPVDHALLGLAGLAIGGVDFGVASRTVTRSSGNDLRSA